MQFCHRTVTHTNASKDLRELLIRCGLSADEAGLLLVIYRHPNSSTGRLAQLAGLKRGHTYNLVGSLLAKCLVAEVQERGVARITALPPSQLLVRIDNERQGLAELLGDLNQSLAGFARLIPANKGAPRIQVFRGSAGVRELYDLTLVNKEKIIRGCADFRNLFPRKRDPELNDWLWRYADRRAKKGIVYRGIVSRSAESDLAFKRRRAQKRELRMIASSPLLAEINIFDNQISICSSADEMVGILIESGSIATSAKVLFDTLWDFLPEYKAG